MTEVLTVALVVATVIDAIASYVTFRYSLRLKREIAAAKALMAPADPSRWPTFSEEDLCGALRNILQVKTFAMDMAKEQGALLDRIALILDLKPGRWTLAQFDAALLEAEQAKAYVMVLHDLHQLVLRASVAA